MNVYNFNLAGQPSNGPGIAAAVVLKHLLDELINKKLLSRQEVQRLLAIADGTIEGMGEYTAVKDARAVLNKMRGL